MKKIKIIFKTHLDIGFTHMAATVLPRCLEKDIPQAIKTANYFRRRHADFRYCWTVGSWLIYEALERADTS